MREAVHWVLPQDMWRPTSIKQTMPVLEEAITHTTHADSRRGATPHYNASSAPHRTCLLKAALHIESLA